MKRKMQDNSKRNKKLSNARNNEKKPTYEQFFPIIKTLRKLPFSIRITALLFGILSYTLYIIIGVSTESIGVTFFSFMHILQISFSICIFYGFISLDIFHRRFIDILKESKSFLEIKNDDYHRFVLGVIEDLGNKRSVLVALPLILISSTIFIFGVGPNIPDSNFPVSSNSALFIFVTIGEFSFFMLYLLGAIGFWFAICLIKTYYVIGTKFKMRIPAL